MGTFDRLSDDDPRVIQIQHEARQVAASPALSAPYNQVLDTEDPMKIGYHVRKIKKGKLGEISKIREELEELEDAEEQGVKIMAAVEASDLLGALIAYVKKHHGLTLADLEQMHEVTYRAFKSGKRK